MFALCIVSSFVSSSHYNEAFALCRCLCDNLIMITGSSQSQTWSRPILRVYIKCVKFHVDSTIYSVLFRHHRCTRERSSTEKDLTAISTHKPNESLDHSGWSVPMLKPYLGLQNGDSTLPRIAFLTSLTAKNIYSHDSLQHNPSFSL